MKRITVEMLRAHKACGGRVELFERIFPRGAPLSMWSLVKAQKAGLDTDWGSRLLSPSARAKYEKVCNVARVEVYEKMCASARAKYEKVRALHWAKYEKACAAALVAALRSEEEKP